MSELKFGTVIKLLNEEFVITNIDRKESTEGVVVYIRAVDKDLANSEQEQQIKMKQTQNQIVDMLRKMTGGEGGNIGFGFPMG
jgi:hypothetical protein